MTHAADRDLGLIAELQKSGANYTGQCWDAVRKWKKKKTLKKGENVKETRNVAGLVSLQQTGHVQASQAFDSLHNSAISSYATKASFRPTFYRRAPFLLFPDRKIPKTYSHLFSLISRIIIEELLLLLL